MKNITRILILLIFIGLSITTYLAYLHYSGKEAECSKEPGLDCNVVLSSSYATVVGVSIALWGFLVYLAILAALIIHTKKESLGMDKVLLFLPSVGAVAAGFYTTTMILKIGAICLWCEASHITMILVFITVARHIRPHWSYKKIFLSWFLFVLFGALISIVVSSPAKTGDVTSFAKCLTSKNVTFYGTYWCPHCKEQKEMFGEAFKFVKYVECADANNPKIQLDICEKAGIQGYPTWDFGTDKRITGPRSLKELAKLSECNYTC